MSTKPNPTIISNPGKILFPESGITKQELVEYYHWIWPYIKDYLKGRPVSLERYPNGIRQDSFYQKDTPKYFPDYIERVIVEDEKKKISYTVINRQDSLVYVANLASLPIHTWQSRQRSLEYPDQLIWDLDPSDDNFEKVRIGARLLKYFLDELGLESYLKVTGSKGLHILVPIVPEYTYEQIKAFSRSVAVFMANRLPEIFTTELLKRKRGNRIFLDYLRNQFGHTAVAPYSVRALPFAPVAVPILWKELDKKTVFPRFVTIRNIKERIEDKGELWKGIYKKPQRLEDAMQKLDTFIKKNKNRSNTSPAKQKSPI